MLMRQAEVAVKRGNFFLKLGEAFRIRAYLVTYVPVSYTHLTLPTNREV